VPFEDPLSEDLMNNGKLRIVGYLAGLAGVLVTSSAFAQAADAAPAAAAPAPPPQPAPAAADASASTSGSAQVGMALPGAAPQAAAVAGSSDHDSVVGRLAIGYLGRNGVTIADGLGAGVTVIPTPVIGVRYWLSDMLGIDAGLGFGLTSGSVDAGGMSNDLPGWHLFMIHGGVPLSLASAGHFSFQIIPELNLGFAGGSVDAGGMTNKVSGFHLDVGARAGAEIHFGFINVPQLSLQGGVGLRLNMDSQSSTIGGADGSVSHFGIGTTVGDNPWNIFTSNVAALYYF
jgi:hypothetical protein